MGQNLKGNFPTTKKNFTKNFLSVECCLVATDHYFKHSEQLIMFLIVRLFVPV